MKTLVIVASEWSTTERQLLHLFNAGSASTGIEVLDLKDDRLEVDYEKKISCPILVLKFRKRIQTILTK